MPSAAQGALIRAADKLGHFELATRLGITRTKLAAYVSCFVEVPDGILLRTLDLLVEGLYGKPPGTSEPSQDSRRDP